MERQNMMVYILIKKFSSIQENLIDDKGEGYPYPKTEPRALWLTTKDQILKVSVKNSHTLVLGKRNRHQQLWTNNVSTYDVKNSQSLVCNGLFPEEQKDAKREQEEEEEVNYCKMISTSSKKTKRGWKML